ncbi:MAG: hypothetical protein RBU27_03270 [Bacteroidota bacterium]|jgi:hypothetical protein|nr:hypothetical protein [Bacteroidota bacterium]
MKSFICALFVLLVTSGIPDTLSAASKNPPLSKERQEYIETNLLAGLSHSSAEVRASYMQLVIDLKRVYPRYDFDYAIIPLMALLKGEDDCPMRMMAALALYEFEDSRKSRFAVQQTMLHCSSARLARHCKTLLVKWNQRDDRPVYTASVVYPFDMDE